MQTKSTKISCLHRSNILDDWVEVEMASFKDVIMTSTVANCTYVVHKRILWDYMPRKEKKNLFVSFHLAVYPQEEQHGEEYSGPDLRQR